MHIFHKWTKWSQIKVRDMLSPTPFDMQQRTCKKCGYTQRRSI